VHVSSYDLFGERFNGMRIHKELLAHGHDSDYLVDRKYSEDPRVHKLGSWPLRNLNKVSKRLETYLSRQSDLCVLGLGVFAKACFWQADLLHLQLLHARSFISLRMLPFIANKKRPVLWTLHDPWVTTGHCVHSLGCDRWRYGCGTCPDLSLPLPIRSDRTARNWILKRKSLERSSIHLIVASPWMARRVADSPILNHLPRSIIPFGLDANVFRSGDKMSARRQLNLPSDAKVAAVRWVPHNMLKGTRFAEKALMSLPDGVVTHVLCFESEGQDISMLQRRYTVIPMGILKTGQEVACAMRASDVFMMPSLGETFGMMAIEAMACGTPVVVFEGTSLPEVIHAPHCGIAVPKEDHEALAVAVTQILTKSDMRNSLVENGLSLISREYTEATYLKRHFSLYEKLLAEKSSISVD